MERTEKIEVPICDDGAGGLTVKITKGNHLSLSQKPAPHPRAVRMYSLMGTLSRDGKPVRCTNFIQGVSLRIDCPSVPSYLPDEIDELLDFVYAYTAPKLVCWLGDAQSTEPLCLETFGLRLWFARESLMTWPPGVLEIEVGGTSRNGIQGHLAYSLAHRTDVVGRARSEYRFDGRPVSCTSNAQPLSCRWGDRGVA